MKENSSASVIGLTRPDNNALNVKPGNEGSNTAVGQRARGNDEGLATEAQVRAAVRRLLEVGKQRSNRD